MPVQRLTSGTSVLVPWNWVIVDAWGGGGGGGGNQQTSADGGGGGGGGAFASTVDTGLTIGAACAYAIGGAGAGGINATPATGGGDTTWRSTVVVAKGGALGSPGAGTSPGNAGAGGLASASTGTRAKFDGGWGCQGRDSNTGRGGWGGSSGGQAAGGHKVTSQATWATDSLYPTASTPAGGGHGGDGANVLSGPGAAPAAGNYGGGGGGVSEGTGVTGGAGAAGKVEVYYSPPTFALCLGCG